MPVSAQVGHCDIIGTSGEPVRDIEAFSTLSELEALTLTVRAPAQRSFSGAFEGNSLGLE